MYMYCMTETEHLQSSCMIVYVFVTEQLNSVWMSYVLHYYTCTVYTMKTEKFKNSYLARFHPRGSEKPS